MKVVRIIASLFLATLVMVSSTRFTVGVHYCMGEAIDVAFFADADDCAMEKLLPPCHRQQESTCCDDETIVHESDDFKTVSSQDHIASSVFPVIAQLPVPISDVIPSISIAPEYSLVDHPPLPTPDLLAEHQVFLI